MNFLLLFLLAQTPSAAMTAEELVTHLYDYVREYRAALPSLSCDEVIVSRAIRKGKVKQEVTLTATLRVIRHEGAEKEFTENHNARSVDGHAPLRHFGVPYWVEGGLANAHGFRDAKFRDCYSYEVASQDSGRTLRLSMAKLQRSADPKCREVRDGAWRVVVYDTAVKQITHIETGMSAKASKEFKHPYFASMDYAPQLLGEKTMWLPVRLVARDDKGEREMTSDYSNYHRYIASIEILPVKDGAEP